MEYIKKPMDIEKKSFEIITEELGEKVKKFSEDELLVVKRVIHTTADFEYADLIEFRNNPIELGREAIRNGARIYCDTSMIANGLSKISLKKFEVEAYSLVSDKEVSEIAKERKITRSIVAMEKAILDEKTGIFLIGNAPTALFKLMEFVKETGIKPKLVVGVPVGFVGAAESKKELENFDFPYIRINGRKGGSTVAVSILHGILYGMNEFKDRLDG